MSPPVLVLKVTQTSERFLKMDYLSPKDGIKPCLFRYSPKKSIPIKPEIFDTAELSFDLSQTSKPKFIKEYTPIVKRANIGKNYKQLLYASHFSQFLSDNAEYVPDPSELFELTKRTLDAYNTHDCPEIIFLKALYNFLKNEGFPIQASWWTSLPDSHRNLAKDLLLTPLSEGSAVSKDIELTLHLLKHLSRWIESETEFKPIRF